MTLNEVFDPFWYATKRVINLEKHWHQNLFFRIFILELGREGPRESQFRADEYTLHLAISTEPGKFQVAWFFDTQIKN